MELATSVHTLHAYACRRISQPERLSEVQKLASRWCLILHLRQPDENTNIFVCAFANCFFTHLRGKRLGGLDDCLQRIWGERAENASWEGRMLLCHCYSTHTPILQLAARTVAVTRLPHRQLRSMTSWAVNASGQPFDITRQKSFLWGGHHW